MNLGIIILAVCIIITNSWHVLTAWFSNPPSHQFTGIAHYYADYFLYLSFMVQPSWVVTRHLFTNEVVSPTWIYWFYTLLGKFGNPFFWYNAGIVIASAGALYLWWQLTRMIFPKRPVTQFVAFLFIATASNIVTLGSFWFSPTPALNRLGGVPHQILQTILLLGMIILWHKKKHIAFSVVALLAATSNPIQTLLVSMAILLTDIKSLPYLLPAAAGALFTNMEFAKNPILTAAKVWENNQPVSVSLWQFVLSLGPIALLIPFGIESWRKNLTPIKKMFLGYGALSLLMFFTPLPKLIGTSPVRWLSPAAYTLFPLVAAEGYVWLTKKHSLIGPILIILYVVLTIPSLITQVEARMHPPAQLMYVAQPVINALFVLHNEKSDTVVLTDPTLPYDVIIPVFTNKASFTGHPIHTLYPDTKEQLRHSYFTHEMDESHARQFLIDHRIGYIIVSPETDITYPFLRQIYRNDTLIVYVNKLTR